MNRPQPNNRPNDWFAGSRVHWLVPPGSYEAIVDRWMSGRTTNGKGYSHLIFRIVGGDWERAEAIRMFWETPDGQRASAPICRIFGALDIAALARMEIEGVRCRIGVGHALNWLGQMQNVITHIELLDPSNPNPGADQDEGWAADLPEDYPRLAG
jgi:hypothetical protein